MAEDQPYPPGARRAKRPAAALPCADCGDLLGRGYPACSSCADAVDALWRPDWQALLAAEGVEPGAEGERELAERVLADEVGRHPWTCTDWALALLTCGQCGSELGAGPLGCVRCTIADTNRWAWDHLGHPGAMTGNEHALRVCRAVLRAPHRQRPTIVQSWQLTMPFLLVGELTTTGQAQRIRAHVLAGRYADLAECASYAAMAGLPELPWRRTS
ncbi:hypothetical protein F0L68_14255 [Solihabitans fulvus]|uniref:Uncharacterized protein n=1 Tax=Solihabitans fulvus TaxID=1892852 RepID=A0A5B2XH78_9PSEU|nr:hypothetical protein [Solihabitans fulvus]KAA2262419.1 hypothetical protein F0L68_14255 [Solihabitans fulvus]